MGIHRYIKIFLCVLIVSAVIISTGCGSLTSIIKLDPDCWDHWPEGCTVWFRADSWEELIKVAKPSATTLDRSLMVWCTPDDNDTWIFDVAHVFKIQEEQRSIWAVLKPSEEISPLSEMGGSFISGRATFPHPDAEERGWMDAWENYAELVGQSDNWGKLYKIAYASEPGGAQGNFWFRVILAWQSNTGQWQIIWEGDECYGWHMGWWAVTRKMILTAGEIDASHNTNLPFSITVHEVFSRDGYLGEEIHTEYHRYGYLTGKIPLEVKWTTPVFWEVKKGETWESIAKQLRLMRDHHSEYGVDKWAQALRQSNPKITSKSLKPGMRIIIPSRLEERVKSLAR